MDATELNQTFDTLRNERGITICTDIRPVVVSSEKNSKGHVVRLILSHPIKYEMISKISSQKYEQNYVNLSNYNNIQVRRQVVRYDSYDDKFYTV